MRLKLDSPGDFSMILDIPVKIKPDREFKAELAKICGPEMMEVLGS